MSRTESDTTSQHTETIDALRSRSRESELRDIKYPNKASDNLYRESVTIARAIKLFEVVDTKERINDMEKETVYVAMSHTLFQLLEEASINQTANIPNSAFSTLADLREDFAPQWKPDLNATPDEITQQRALFHIGRGSIVRTLQLLEEKGRETALPHLKSYWLETIHSHITDDIEVSGCYKVDTETIPELSLSYSLQRDYDQFLSSSSS